MEIDETFSSLDEIKKALETAEMTYRISFDDTEMDEDVEIQDWDEEDFSAEANPEEVKKWEAHLPDIEEEPQTSLENEVAAFKETVSSEEKFAESVENAEVVYFDLFKKTYQKTLIFQKEEENETKLYRLIGFCEAPMT